jgi:prepilin-type N-terminal cleavage/methylation domain-containing protein
MKKVLKRKAFTLIEIIMVIVILGIVSMIGADIISNMYSGYIRAKLINEVQQKTELALDQISNRLRFRVKDSVIARKSDGSYAKLSSTAIPADTNILEWIGYDNEGYKGIWDTTLNLYRPAWNGFVDIKNPLTDSRYILSSGSNFTEAEKIVKSFSDNEVDLSGASRAAIIFKCGSDLNVSKYGLDWNKTNIQDHNNTLVVKKVAGDDERLEFHVNQQNAKEICEHYQLAWSAYAIVPNGSNISDFNLTLRYNYQPWLGEKYTASKDVVLAEHVSTFRFKQVGKTIRIKLCIQDGNITGVPIGFCKEKAIY